MASGVRAASGVLVKPLESDLIALDALGALYRLTSYYPTDRGGEGKYLHRAARSLLAVINYWQLASDLLVQPLRRR